MTAFDPYCLSAYLALRYLPRDGLVWKAGVTPALPVVDRRALVPVGDGAGILACLRASVDRHRGRAGILLSSGIDSAILAALSPRDTPAYTIRFVADGAIDESAGAADFADRAGLPHHIVDVTWQDYLDLSGPLMRRKSSPLHAIEVGLCKAAQRAAADGCEALIVGNGADSTFGGMNELLSRDWTLDEFVTRYTFVDPERALVDSRSLRSVFEPYRRGDGVDVSRFLKEVHGAGIVQAFENAVGSGGCTVVAPYEEMVLEGPLDVERIRRGEPKYLLAEVFVEIFGDTQVPAKIPFARPMDQWLGDWPGPSRAEFRADLNVARFSGDQKWLLYCLERFLDLVDD